MKTLMSKTPWGITIAVARAFATQNIYIRNKLRPKLNYLSFLLINLEKVKINPK